MMKSLLAKISALALGATMVVGVGVGIVVSQSDKAYQASASSDTVEILPTSFNGTSYAANNGSHTISSTSSSYSFKYYSNQTMLRSSLIQLQKNNGYVYNETDSGISSISSVVITSDDISALSVYSGSSENAGCTTSITPTGSNPYTYSFGSNQPYFLISNGSATSKLSSILISFDMGSHSAADLVVSPSSQSIDCYGTVTQPTLTATYDGASGTSYSNYTAELGTLSDGTFVARIDSSSFAFASTIVIPADNCVRLTAKDPTVAGGSTYATADIALSVSAAPIYEKVSSLTVGTQYILATASLGSSSNTYVMNTATDQTDYRQSNTYISTTADQISYEPSMELLTLGGSEGAYTLATSAGSYLSWTSSNTLKVVTSASSDNQKWTITIDGSAEIKNNADTTRHIVYNSSSPRFACYTTAQTSVYLYALQSSDPSISLSPSSLSLSTVSSAATLTADVRNADGASISWAKTDASSIISLSATSGSSIEVTPQGSNVGSAVITASMVVGGVTYSAQCDVSVAAVVQYSLVTDVNTLVPGAKIVIAASGYEAAISTNYVDSYENYIDKAVISKVNNTISFASDANVAEFTLGGSTGAWTFYESVKNGYIYAASSTYDNLKYQETNDDNGKWSISIADGIASLVAQGTNTHNVLRYDSYNTDFVSNEDASSYCDLSIYQQVSAEQFATYFLSALSCDATGATAPSTSEWSMQATIFAAMSPLAQSELRNASANASGTTVEQFAARYDYILGKYSTENYANFVNRSLTGLSINNKTSDIVSGDNATLIIVLVAVFGLTAIGGFFFVNKKKNIASK